MRLVGGQGLVTPPSLADSGMAVMQAVQPSGLAIENMHRRVWPEYGMMQAPRGRISPSQHVSRIV